METTHAGERGIGEFSAVRGFVRKVHFYSERLDEKTGAPTIEGGARAPAVDPAVEAAPGVMQWLAVAAENRGRFTEAQRQDLLRNHGAVSR